MWFIFVNAFIYSLEMLYSFSFKDFVISSILFLLIYLFYDKMKKKRAEDLGYEYIHIFNFKFLIFSAIISIITAGLFRFFYFGSFHLQSGSNSLKIKDYPKVIILPIIILFLLAIISLLLNFYIVYNVLIVFVLFNLLPIPGYDGSYLFATDVKKYKIYAVILMLIAILSMFLQSSFFVIVLAFLIILYIYYDYGKKVSLVK